MRYACRCALLAGQVPLRFAQQAALSSLYLQASLEAFENADTPVHMVMVEILGLNMKGAAAAPLFQSMFFLHEAAWWSQVQLQGLRTQTHPVEKNVARCETACCLEDIKCVWNVTPAEKLPGAARCSCMACARTHPVDKNVAWCLPAACCVLSGAPRWSSEQPADDTARRRACTCRRTLPSSTQIRVQSGCKRQGLRHAFNMAALRLNLTCPDLRRHDLTLELTLDAASDTLQGHLEYRADLFHELTAKALCQRFKVLLSRVWPPPLPLYTCQCL